MRLEGRIAIVTGAGRGIGRAIAKRLADEGATVICADVDEQAAEEAAFNCNSEALAATVDVSSRGACDDLIRRTVDGFGCLDVMVNNAGINRDAMLHKMSDEQWDSVIAVDLSAVFYLTRAAGRVMREAGHGRIINISSASWMGNIGQANYAAAKAGVVGLTRTAAKELARAQVTANAICPGFIDTEMTRRIPQEVYQAQIERIPLGRAGQPSDVANLVAFLASDEAGYLTGEVISVGGGYTL